MDRWLIFIRERFPIIGCIVLVAGICLSGIYLAGRAFVFLPFVFSFVGLFLSCIVLFLIDEVRNLPKDRIAHPQRPLPRGVLTKYDVVRVIELLLMILFAYSLVIWVCLQATAALANLVVTVYLWLIYKDFRMGHWLESKPFLYGIARHLIIFFVVFFAVAVARPGKALSPEAWSLGGLLFGALFCYEICRKLDPHTHPTMGTYINFYGFRRTFEFTFLMIAFSAMGAVALHVAPLLIPCQLVMLSALATLFFQPAFFRIPETVSTISLFLHAWAIPLFYIF